MNTNHLRNKLQKGKRLNVLFINDMGFQYGAGLAHLRQIQSLLLLGHEVKALCWMQSTEGAIPFVPFGASGSWKGMHQLPEVHFDNSYDKDAIIRTILKETISFQPDVIIIGNLHGAQWPLELLIDLRDLDSLVIAYMHDCYFITGRCAYPGNCSLYETGCNESCPTFNEYPQLNPTKIYDAWKLRRKIFCGTKGVPIATNSRWLLDMARRSLKDEFIADVIYLGLDDRLFRPIDRKIARRLLGLPENEFIILSGSVNVKENRKGGHIFKEVVTTLNKKNVIFLVFGEESLGLKNVKATGFLRDYRKMSLLYSAADLFLGTAIEEAFGQTICESLACALPVVAFNVGGIPEVARHNVNARLVHDISVAGLLDEIEFFMRNSRQHETFGLAGREMVKSEFSLKRQGERWMKYLNNIVSTFQAGQKVKA